MELLGDVGHVESSFSLFGDVCRCKIGAQFVLNVPWAQESFWMHLMVLLSDEAQVKACFCLFEDSANLDARWVCCLCRTYHWPRNRSGCTLWNS
jgi:hypothetical protein